MLGLLSQHQVYSEANDAGPNEIYHGSFAFLAGKSLCLLSSSISQKWIIDSGATDHITPNLDLFLTYKPLTFKCSITMLNGQKTNVTHNGSVQLTASIVIHQVLHVPNFQFNLLSVQKLAKQLSANLISTPSHCIVQGASLEKHLVLGNQDDGLYFVNTDLQVSDLVSPNNSAEHTKSPSSHVSMHSNNYVACSLVNAHLWHCRLGHLPFDRLKCIPGIDCSVSSHSICNICPQAKLHRNPFPTSHIKTSSPFQLIHVDIWGPYRYPTYNGFRYFLTIVDDFSRATWVHLFSHKTNVFTLLQAFVSYAETQFHTSIKSIRSDNGLEFCEKHVEVFYKSKGIIHQTSCVDTPQQNGVVERKHRHFLETARAVFFQANLPIGYWGECILAASYLINRYPLTSIQNKTPYEIIFNQIPSYTHLKAFGCLCYASTPKHNRAKFQPRERPCVFLGYPFAKKAYKLLDLATNKVFYSYVIFHEHHFPFHHVKHSNSSTPLPVPPSDLSTIFFPTQTPAQTFSPANHLIDHIFSSSTHRFYISKYNSFSTFHTIILYFVSYTSTSTS